MKLNMPLKPAEAYVMPLSDSGSSRGFLKIAVGSTALGLGCMAAVAEALGRDAAGFTFQVSAGTFVAFAVGAAAGVYYWKMAAKSLLALRVASVVLLLAGVAGFLYPLRFVPASKMSEIGLGLGLAVAAISCGAAMLWRLKRFFEADDAAVKEVQ